jgi:nucleoside-diphosphate-sugar epimerase
LVAYGSQVNIFDNFSTGSYKNLHALKDKIDNIEADIRDLKSLKQATCNKDIIFHTAAQVSVPESFKQAELFHTTNLTNTFNVLEAARINKIKRVIFSSSSAVYGPTLSNTPQPCKNTNACNPTSPYGFSKLIGEHWCHEYPELHAVATVALRYFNVFGPRQNPDSPHVGVIAKFKSQMDNN